MGNIYLETIPNDWEIKKGDEITSKITKGASPRWQGFNYQKHGMLFVTSENVRDGFLDISSPKFLPLEFHKKLANSQLRSDDILINIVGASIGRACQYKSNYLHANINQAVCLFRTNSKVYSRYILYYLQLPRTIANLIGTQSETARPNLSLSDLKRFKFIIPPLLEQHKIAEILSTWDNAIEKTEHLIDILQQRKNGLMQRLLTGQVRFPGFDGEWKEYKLEQVASKNRYSFTGGPFGSNLKAESYTPKGVRIIQLQNIGDGEFLDNYKIYTSEEKADELISCNIYPGDIILSKMGDPVARATIIPNTEKRYLMASDGIRLEIDKEHFDTQFILESINAFEFRTNAIRHSVGSTRQRISLGDLRNLPIKSPLITEQQRISSVLQACNQEIELHRQKLELLKQQKKGLMQKLLTGQIRVKV